MMKLVLKNKCKIFFYRKVLFFIGYSTLFVLNFSNFFNKILFFIKKHSFEIHLIDCKIKAFILSKINAILKSMNLVFRKKILLFGIGFRCWVCRMDSSNFIVLRVGTSRDVFIKLPCSIHVMVLKSTFIMFYSLNKIKLNQFVSFLYCLKPADSYKGKGFRYLKQNLQLKPGKRS